MNTSKNRFRTQTQNTSTNNSIDSSYNQALTANYLNYPAPVKGSQSNNRLNVFDNKAHSVDIILNSEYTTPELFQHSRVKKDRSTASKFGNQMQLLASEVPTPNLMNQITFNDEETEQLRQRAKQLSNENLSLISKKINK